MSNIYRACYYGGMIAAIVLFVVAIVLFFVLKIPSVFGELTGSSARRELKTLKAKGTRKSDGSNEPKHYSQRTGAIKTRTTDAPSGELSRRENTTSGLIRGKDKKKKSYHLDENQTEFLGESKITAAVTGDIAETAVLSQNDVESENLEFINTDNLKSDKTSEKEIAVAAEESSEQALADLSEDVTTSEANSSPNQVEEFANDEDEATEVLSDSENEATEVLSDSEDEATEVLSDSEDEATEVLSDSEDEATEVLSDSEDEATEVLSDSEDEATEVLSEERNDDFGDDQDDEDEATEVLASEFDDEGEATEVLTSGAEDEATEVLTSDTEVSEYGETSVLSIGETKIKTKNYIVLYNVMEVHTSEKL